MLRARACDAWELHLYLGPRAVLHRFEISDRSPDSNYLRASSSQHNTRPVVERRKLGSMHSSVETLIEGRQQRTVPLRPREPKGTTLNGAACLPLPFVATQDTNWDCDTITFSRSDRHRDSHILVITSGTSRTDEIPASKTLAASSQLPMRVNVRLAARPFVSPGTLPFATSCSYPFLPAAPRGIDLRNVVTKRA